MPVKLSNEDLERVADVLMGAAHADGSHQDEEGMAIDEVMSDLLGQGKLPAPLRRRIDAFDVRKFDLQKTCAALKLETPEQRKMLLQLVAKVTEVDGVHDFDESDYIVQVARYIGAPREEYAGLTVDVEYEASAPPPVPGDHDK